MTAPEPVVLASYPSHHEAEMARGLLEEADITAVIRSDDVGGMRPDLTLQGRLHLWVPGDEADEARALLEDAGLLQDVVPPMWSAVAGPRSLGHEPGLSRALLSMALLFGGVAVVVLSLFFGFLQPARTWALIGVAAFLAGLALIRSDRSPARQREGSAGSS